MQAIIGMALQAIIIITCNWPLNKASKTLMIQIHHCKTVLNLMLLLILYTYRPIVGFVMSVYIMIWLAVVYVD